MRTLPRVQAGVQLVTSDELPLLVKRPTVIEAVNGLFRTSSLPLRPSRVLLALRAADGWHVSKAARPTYATALMHSCFGPSLRSAGPIQVQ